MGHITRPPTMRANLRAVSLVAIALALSACSSGPSLSTGHSRAVVTTPNLPTPDAANSSISLERDYHIGPLDQLDVTVFQVEDLTRSVQVDAVGRISLPLIGPVDAAGKTPIQLQAELADKLSHFIRSPQVNVYVKQAQSQKFTVDGSVTTPGIYPLSGRMTLMEAIATAHGLDRFARTNEVVVFRTVNGQKMAGVFDLGGIRSGRYADPEIYGNDLIEVNESLARRTLFDLISITPLVSMFSPLY